MRQSPATREKGVMNFSYPEIGVCGLSCRLCPSYHIEGKSRCPGCKSEFRMGAGCPFITCAVKKKGIEFCWECDENSSCEKWANHRAFGLQHDTFVCYQRLESNIGFIHENGERAFEKEQKARERLLREMLRDFNEGRSKRYYSIAAAVMEIEELEEALRQAGNDSQGLDRKARARILHNILNGIAKNNNYLLKLRK